MVEVVNDQAIDQEFVDEVLEQCAPKIPYRKFQESVAVFRNALDPPTLTPEKVYEKILLKREKGFKGIYTGVTWWDYFAGPMRRGNTYAIAGFPGTGKTTLALNLAWSIAKKNIPVWYYCLELSSDEVFEVLAGHITGDANVSKASETLAYAQMQGTPFRFYEPGGFQPWEKRLEEIFLTVKNQKIEVVFIDNLSFLVRVAKNQTEAESQASARIKMLAQELEIVIVLIHHLRKPESDQNEPEPNAHSMRGSGTILADASDSYILHHPIMQGGEQTRHPVGYLLSGKPRWGKGGKIFVRLEGEKRTYHKADREEYQKAPRNTKREREY